jgi:heme/copper-type cytochrome/quinol oxidase subunit 4
MISKARLLKIARTALGLAVAVELIYFLYSKNSPPGASAFITLAAVLLLILRRRSGAFDTDPYWRRLSMVSSRKPLRDLGMSIVCFVATMAVTIAIGIGVRNRALPDNYVTVGFLIVVIVAGILGMLFFLCGVIGRIVYGPPPP